MNVVLFGLGIIGAAVLIALYTGFGHDAVSIVAAQTGLALPHEKLGWMDDAEITVADRRRIAAVTGISYDSNLAVIRSIQGGTRGNLTRNDFELLRQDRRRAKAAYPDVDPEKLFTSGWFNVDMNARIPMDFCTSHNSNGTKGADGKWYLDGGCYLSFVNSEFPNRADVATTKLFYTNLKIKERAEKLARLKASGPFAAWGGTGGSMSVNLSKDGKNVIVRRAQEWARTGKKWTMPFIAEEWVDIYAGDLDAIKALPSFAAATEKDEAVTPSGVTMTMGGSISSGHIAPSK